MANGDSDCRNLDAINRRIGEVELSVAAFRRLLDRGTLPPTDTTHLTRAKKLLEDLYAQRQALLDRWRAEPD